MNPRSNNTVMTKLAVAMLALIGAAMVVATIVADVASLELSAAVSWMGKIGVSAACLMGVGFFAGGMQKGLARATDNFEAAAKGVNVPQSAGRDRVDPAPCNIQTPLLSLRRC